MPAELRTERRDATLLLTLSDPSTRNALSEQIYAAGIESLNVAESDDELRAIVIQGDGGTFCAGGDIQRLLKRREGPRDAQRAAIDRLHEWVAALRAFPKPVIACVEGAAAGAGFSLALACDLIVAAEDARFVVSYGRVGLSPDGGAIWHLSRALPRHLVLQLGWLAEPIGARRLEALGLVARVAAPGEALAAALELAERLGRQTAPNVVASVKELASHWPPLPLAEHLVAEREHFVENLFHRNGGEGLRAFLEKRKPTFE